MFASTLCAENHPSPQDVVVQTGQPALLNGDAPADDVLFSTSFERQPEATFQQLKISSVEINATGTASITSRFAHSGDKCLHMLGDTKNKVTLVLPPELSGVKGIRFDAERWTAKGPFEFKVEVQQDGKWHDVAQLDHVIEVGARFRSHIQLPVAGNAKTEAIRFSTKAAPQSGLLIDDLSLHASVPKRPTTIPTDVMPSDPLKPISSQSLFVSGTQDTHTFRIPAIVTATNGDLIAACDARRTGSGDLIPQRTIDIVFRRSSDNGKTWTPMEILDQSDDGGCSDPSLLVDKITGDLFCFYNFMVEDKSNKEFRFYVQKSSDHGKNWGKPEDFTSQVAGPELKNAFKFITSGRGIQTRDGTLVHNYVRVGKGITLFASRDHGRTWRTLSDVTPGDESKVVQLSDGALMVNSRIAPGKRFVHRSADSGKSWESAADFGLPDPRCNASIIQYTARRDGYSKDRLLFCNAASNQQRQNLSVRISYNDGANWSAGKVIDRGPSGYSEITILNDGSFGVLYESGLKEIRFVRFSLAALTNGTDQLNRPYAHANKVEN
ncbi:Sialidase precursor [Planctomycetes bacterium CA13]|uniref:exo-alpha-sialidase n=2 Tax=Novipirellula herctigrandis TaxID=2527986 RepID=A0A5C5ZDK8_9BACT|nr:Sialidase precursor [Planctomycetes bacterium CA13]